MIVWSYYRTNPEWIQDDPEAAEGLVPQHAWRTQESAKRAAEADWKGDCADNVSEEEPFQPLQWEDDTDMGPEIGPVAVVDWDQYPDGQGGTHRVRLDYYQVYSIEIHEEVKVGDEGSDVPSVRV